MKSYITIKRVLSLSVIVFFLALTIGCSEQGSITSFEEENSVSTTKVDNIESKRVKSLDLNAISEFSDQPEYPQSVSCIATFKRAKDNYNGGACQLPNRSSFEFQNGALNPPLDHPSGETVIITMIAEKDPLTNEIIFTFGPSGCTFDTPAEVWLNWSDLGVMNASLYYLASDGTRIEELPDQIDVYNRQMCIRINHFSRYALAYSN